MLVTLQPGEGEAEPPALAEVRKVGSSLERGIVGLGIRNHVEAEFGKIHGLLKGSGWEAGGLERSRHWIKE